MSITLQFIDAEWNLHNVPIAFANIIGPHTAEAVGHLIADKLSLFLGMSLSPFPDILMINS